MMKGLKYLGIIITLTLAGSVCFAGDGYLIVPVPDTIVAPTPLDQAVYTNTAEFFTPYIVNEINKTHYMHAPTVTDVRNKIKKDYWLTKSAAKAMDDFRRYYILDFNFAKKIANMYNTNLVLLLTSSLDANNYVMRRTWWTFFEIPGSSALDPAIKINIYSVLIDTDKNMIIWSKTYQKTISTVENRIVPIGYTPQTEQLQKFKDYSVYLAPRFAQSLQDTLLTTAQKIAEPNIIHTDYGSIDNTFTKKYRTLRKEVKDATVIPAAKTRENYGKARAKYLEMKEQWEAERAQKAIEKQNKPKPDKNIEPINFLWFRKKDTVTNETPLLEPMPDTQEAVNQKSTPETIPSKDTQGETENKQTETAKEVIQNTGLNPSPATNKQTEAVTPEVPKQEKAVPQQTHNTGAKQTPAESQPQTPPIPANTQINEKPAINITTEKTNKKDNIIKINNKKQSEQKNGINIDEHPVDVLIYTQPTNYRPSEEESEYLPVKPRLREINIDDTVNSF